MLVTIRKFEERDVSLKVEWINNPDNNQFLHYDIPLEVGKTVEWFHRTKDNPNRYDAIIEADGIPCGTIGLLNIDYANKKAEYYIAMGNTAMKRKGIAAKASQLLLDYAFFSLDLNRVYLYTEEENFPAQRLFERVGFIQEGFLKNDLVFRGKIVNRYVYGLCKSDYKKEC